MLRAPGVQQIREVFGRKEKGRFEIQIVEGAKHGFAVRGNPEDEEEARQAQKAEDQAVAWFERWS